MSMISDATRAASQWAIKKADELRVTDALVNLVTGLGTSRDKSMFTAYVDSPMLTVFDLETLWKDSALARKIVSKLPKDALRNGFTVRRRGSSVDDSDEEMCCLNHRLVELKVCKLLYQASVWGRLFGGAGIVMSLVGAGGPSTKLDLTRVLGIDSLRVCDRQDFRPAYWGPDGSTERWWWQRVSKGGGPVGVPVMELHTSRVLWFGGAETTDRGRVRNEYWDHSVLQAVFKTLLSYDAYWASLDAQVMDASQAVFHLQGFIKALAESSSETGQALSKRLAIMDRGRSNSRALVLDAGDNEGKGREDFQVVERASLANMDKLTDRYTAKLATDTWYPVSVLFEQAASGTNATGESDLILYFNNVDVFRTNELQPQAEELVRLVAQELGITDCDELEIVWPELWKPKPLDIASAEKMKVDSAIGLIGAGAVLEEEVALSLDTLAPNMGLKVDRDARKEAMKAGLDEVMKRTVMDPSAGEVAAQTTVKKAGMSMPMPGKAPAGGPANKASGRATKAKADQASAKPRSK